MPVLSVRKLADTSTGERLVRYDPVTGEKKLVNPATPGDGHEPWPLAGVRIEGDPPTECTVPTGWVQRGVAEGWLRLENQRPVVRPAGPTMNVWSSTHTGAPHVFLHADAIVVDTVDGPVRYVVTHQPDKYHADGDDDTPVTEEAYAAGQTRVDHFYGLRMDTGEV